MFHFDDSVVEAITGPRLRAELTMYELPYLPEESRLTLGAEYQDDDVRGSQSFVSARLRIPLQAERREQRLNWQERRMTDHVVRDVDIVTEQRSVKAPDIVETGTVGGQAVTIINSETTSGADLQNALNNAGANSFVVLAGTFVTTSTTTLQTGQTMMGAGALTVQTASGKTATLTMPEATIEHSFTGTGTAVLMADGSTLTGMTINSTATNGTRGVWGNMAHGLTITNNTITVSASSNSATAITMLLSSATISGNILSATSTPGYYATALFANGGSYTVSGNTFSASGGDISRTLSLNNGVTAIPSSAGNTLVSGACFITGGFTGSIGFTDGSTCP